MALHFSAGSLGGVLRFGSLLLDVSNTTAVTACGSEHRPSRPAL